MQGTKSVVCPSDCVIRGDGDEIFASHPSASHRSSRQMRSSLDLSKWCDWWNNCDSGREINCLSVDISVHGFGRAVSRDVASLSALVAGFAGSVEGSSVWCSAISGDVSELATSVAFHCLSLTITSKVVWSATLVACSWTRTTNSKTSARWAAKATTRGEWCATTNCSHLSGSSWAWA